LRIDRDRELGNTDIDGSDIGALALDEIEAPSRQRIRERGDRQVDAVRHNAVIAPSGG